MNGQHDFQKTLLRDEFEHGSFQYNRPDLLCNITRKTSNNSIHAHKKRPVYKALESANRHDPVPVPKSWEREEEVYQMPLNVPLVPSPPGLQTRFTSVATMNMFTAESDLLLKELVHHRVMTNNFEKRLQQLEKQSCNSNSGPGPGTGPAAPVASSTSAVESECNPTEFDKLKMENEILRSLINNSLNKQMEMESKMSTVLGVMREIMSFSPIEMKMALTFLRSGASVDEMAESFSKCRFAQKVGDEVVPPNPRLENFVPPPLVGITDMPTDTFVNACEYLNIDPAFGGQEEGGREGQDQEGAKRGRWDPTPLLPADAKDVPCSTITDSDSIAGVDKLEDATISRLDLLDNNLSDFWTDLQDADLGLDFYIVPGEE